MTFKDPNKTSSLAFDCPQFSCVDGEPDHIGAVAEIEACTYTLFVYTSKICHHPYLRPTPKAKPSPIECQPLVTQAIYDAYLTDMETRSTQPGETSHYLTETPLVTCIVMGHMSRHTLR